MERISRVILVSGAILLSGGLAACGGESSADNDRADNEPAFSTDRNDYKYRIIIDPTAPGDRDNEDFNIFTNNLPVLNVEAGMNVLSVTDAFCPPDSQGLFFGCGDEEHSEFIPGEFRISTPTWVAIRPTEGFRDSR